MTGWIAAIVIGLIAGALAKFIMPGNDPGGCIITTLLGIVGSVIGYWIADFFGFGGEGLVARILIATLGAVILLAIYRMVVGRR